MGIKPFIRTAPFIFHGPASSLESYESESPNKTVWELEHVMPDAIYEEAGGRLGNYKPDGILKDLI